jgi:hypothetical protein
MRIKPKDRAVAPERVPRQHMPPLSAVNPPPQLFGAHDADLIVTDTGRAQVGY